MIEGHRLHEAHIDGRGIDPAGVFAIEALPAPGAVTVLALHGELDMAAAPAVRARIDGAATMRAVVVDLARVTFVDSSMLKELLRANGELERAGARLVLCGVPPAVRRLLDLTRTAALFTLAEDLPAALRRAGEDP